VADIVIRPEVEQADIAAITDAHTKMQALTGTDNRSWVYWSEFHGFNRYDCWHHGRTGPGPGTQFTYDLFLPWHRAYLLGFENAMRDQNPDAILPWWDWTTPLSHQDGIPPSFAGTGADDPLATGTMPAIPPDGPRRTSRDPQSPSVLPFMDQPNPAWGLPSVQSVLDLPQFADFSNQLQDIHDAIHGWVGGDMGSIAVSAFDPIFWSHHAMIDRLWYLWQLKWGVNNIPIDYLDKVLSPFPFTVRQVLDVRALGYDYAVANVVATVSTGHH
jgi:tyrosinase